MVAGGHGHAPKGTFMVTIENVSTPYEYFAAGGQFIPDGLTDAGPAHPGQSFTIHFHAGKGHKLSFATMYGASNDLFYGTRVMKAFLCSPATRQQRVISRA